MKVCKTLAEVGEQDADLLVSAILHDVLEDTDTSSNELNQLFGKTVASIVEEVSDNMALSEIERKTLQITKAPSLSRKAKLIKIADKLCNINDLLNYPINWSTERKLKYVNWSYEVYNGCKGENNLLDNAFTSTCKNAKNIFSH